MDAFVLPCIDYFNALLIGYPDAGVQKLHLLQNSATCLVSKTGRYEHITLVHKALHWLPVRYRIDFKIIILPLKP